MKQKKKSKLTVVYIITKLELGGAQKVCLSLFNKLNNKEINTYLISNNNGALVNSINNYNNTILIKELKRELSLSSIIHEIKAFFKLIKILKNIKKFYNNNIIVHTHSSKAGILGRWAAFFSNIKYRVHTIHGYGFHKHQNLFSWFFLYLIELATSFITTHFVCVSTEDIKKGIKLFPGFKKKYSLIRAAIDYKLAIKESCNLIKFPEKDQNFIFGTISCFKPQKNLLDLLKAFAEVNYKNPNTRLEIIGDGIERDIIQNWITKNNLTNNIKLYGWQENIFNIIKNWHVFTLSSLWEGLPCSVVEARTLKIPVLSYNTGGIKEVIFSGYNGFLYPQKDWKSLSTGMLEISQTPELFCKLQSYQDDLKDFNDSYMADQHRELYKNLVN